MYHRQLVFLISRHVYNYIFTPVCMIELVFHINYSVIQVPRYSRVVVILLGGYLYIISLSCSCIVCGTTWSTKWTRNFCPKDGKLYEGKPEVSTKRDKLKKAIKEYGTTVMVFHVTISLVSLGAFYLLVSSGVDIVSVLKQFDSFSSSLSNSNVVGASNFFIAYALHKIFAPVRIGITLSVTPFIVRYLRSKGFLKIKIQK